jgi:hypothetical protein
LPLKSKNRLIVEGFDDLQSVAALMGAHTPWPQDKYKSPVWIEISNGAEEILQDGFLKVYIQSPEVRTLGVMFDADDKPSGRYQRVRTLCEQFFPTLPKELPPGGCVVENTDNKRLGFWLMPDNASDGDMETFLKFLVPDDSVPVWAHAVECVTTAKGIGCPCRDSHLTKANLYTWLAWQDPPGQSPGRALTKKILDPHGASATAFVDWFMQLYALPPIEAQAA